MPSFSTETLPRKVELTGADCFHLVLDKHASKHGAGGNVMRKVFYFDHSLSFEKIDTLLKCSPIIHWLCNIKLESGGLFKIPYWYYDNKGHEPALQLHHSKDESEVPIQILDRDITVFSDRFIEADLILYPSGGSALVISWNHILLDARGTSLLFDHLDLLHAGHETNGKYFFPEKEKSPGIFAYIRNMYAIKSFIQNSSKPPIRSVYNSEIKNNVGATKTRVIRFSREESEKIIDNAVHSGSRFGPTLFFIACCAQTIHQYFNHEKNPNDSDLWIPVPYDGRLRGAVGPLISNCVSFLFYRIPSSALHSVEGTVKNLYAQMTRQIKDRIPQRYTMFLNMMRHIPLWLYYFIISRTGKGVFSSFLYTSTGEHFNKRNTLFGEKINRIDMIPALTFPPGLTFVFLQQEDCLSVNIAYSAEIMSDNAILLTEQKLREILLDPFSKK